MTITQQHLEKLAKIIVDELKLEFSTHLSGNLINTISVVSLDGVVQIKIPAQVYDLEKYFDKKVIVHTGKGSYASSLDTKGSEFMVYDKKGQGYLKKPHNHKGFVNKIVDDSIQKWLKQIECSKETKVMG